MEGGTLPLGGQGLLWRWLQLPLALAVSSPAPDPAKTPSEGADMAHAPTSDAPVAGKHAAGWVPFQHPRQGQTNLLTTVTLAKSQRVQGLVGAR